MQEFVLQTRLPQGLLALDSRADSCKDEADNELGQSYHYQAYNGVKNGVFCSLDVTGGNGCGDAEKSGAGLTGIIKLAVNLLSLIVGVAAVIMIIIGGLKYITSQGESSNTASAKSTILYAVIGLIVVALAQFIVRFTLNRAGQASAGCKTGQKLQPNGSCK